MMRQRTGFLFCLFLFCVCLGGCGKEIVGTYDENIKNENVTKDDARSELEEIMPEGTRIDISGDTIEIESQYGLLSENVQSAMECIKNHDFKNAAMIIHGKNGIGYYYCNDGTETYYAEMNGVKYSSYYEDFIRICAGSHPYIISQEANDLLYNNRLVDSKFYEEYTFGANGNLIVYCDKEVFWNNVATKSYELAAALFDADENIMHITFQQNGDVNAFNYQRDSGITNDMNNEDTVQNQVESDNNTYAAVVNVYNTLSNYMNGNSYVQFTPDELETIAQNQNSILDSGMIEAPIQITTNGNMITFLYDGGAGIVWNTENDDIHVVEEDIYNEQDFEGLYYSDSNDPLLVQGSTVEIKENEDGYSVNINFVRLTSFEDCEGYFQDGFIYFSGTDINGNIVSGEISLPASGELMLVFTQSSWGGLDGEHQYMFYK